MRHRFPGRAAPLVAALAIALIVVVPAPSSIAQTSPEFSEAFFPASIGPGATTTLTFTVDNRADVVPATDLAFTNSLPSGVTIATPANVENGCGGKLSAPDGGTLISLTDGGVGELGDCSIRIDVTSSTTGAVTDETSSLTSSAGTSLSATAVLNVTADLPGFTKSFETSPIPFGHRSTLTFAIDNSRNSNDVTEFTFDDTLPAGMVIAEPNGASTDCGPAALPTTFSQITAVPGTSVIEFDAFGFLSGGNEVVAAGATCTAVVDVVAGPSGAAENSTGPSTVELNDSNISRPGGVANDTLEVTRAPIHLTKEFTDDPVLPGAAATVRFTATNFDRDFDAIDVAFTDDVGAALSGLVVVGPLPVDPCGAASSLSGEGTGVLELRGGIIAAVSTCEFEVTVVVPDGSSSRSTSTTGAVSGAVDGLAVTGNEASDDLFVVLAPVLTEAFTDDPEGAGGNVTLVFTVTNPDPSNAMTDIAFADNLDPVLPSASVVAGTPAPPAPGGVDVNNVCGAGSNFSYVPRSPGQPTTLELTDGSLAAGDSCSFSVVLDVAASAASGGYSNTTSSVGAVLLGSAVTGDAATDELLVVGAPPLRTLFLDDPVGPGGAVTLLFTVVNGGEGENDFDSIGPIDDIMFTDDLTFASGLTTVAPLPAEPCGVGSSLATSAGGGLLTLTGGNLLEDESCTFAVTLQTTASTPHGLFTNATSAVSATASGIPVTGPGDSDDMLVTGATVLAEHVAADPRRDRADLSVTSPGKEDRVGTGDTLDYTIDVFNAGPDAARNVVVVDELPRLGDRAAVTLVSTSGCQNDPFTLTCELGNLAADTGATFTITVRVNGNTTGTITNTAIVSSESFDGGLSDNATIAETVVNAAANPPVRRFDVVAAAAAEGGLALAVTSTDAGSSDAVNVVAGDPLPAAVGTSGEKAVVSDRLSRTAAPPIAWPSLSLRESAAATLSSGVAPPRPNSFASPAGALPANGSNSSSPISSAALWMLAAGLGCFTLGRTKRRSRSA